MRIRIVVHVDVPEETTLLTVKNLADHAVGEIRARADVDAVQLRTLRIDRRGEVRRG